MIHHYNQIDKPKVVLNGIEYLLLSIQSNPGKSQRWHLKRKHLYQHGYPDFHKGGSGCGYFTSPSYRDVLWFDLAAKNVEYPVWAGSKVKSKCAQMHLTMAGWVRANEVRQKIGLDPRPTEVYLYKYTRLHAELQKLRG